MTSCFSLFSLFGIFVRRTFTSSGLSPQTIEIDSQTTISFWSPTPNSQSIEKPYLVLLHGFGPRAEWQWQPQVKTLSPHFNLVVPDLIFFGNSTTKSSDRSIAFQASSIGKLLEKLGVKRFSIIGTSYGGFVAYDIARLFGERVEKVIISSSDINTKLWDNEGMLERMKVEKIEDVMLPKNASQLRNMMAVVMLNPPSYMPDFFLNDMLKYLYSDNLAEKKELLHAFLFLNDDQVHVSPLQQEVLILWGEHDKIFPLAKAMELKEILGDKARLEVIKHTSHAPQNEDSNQFNDLVMKFLSDKFV